MIVFEGRASTILFNVLSSRGDRRRFLMPANVCPIVPATFDELGQPFELVDIIEPWLSIDVEACMKRVRAVPQQYAGLLYVHAYGSERDASSFFVELKRAHRDLLVIDDKCLCRPDCDGASLAAGADVTLFSTGYAKYVDLGSGGFAHLDADLGYTRSAASVPDWLDHSPPESSWDAYRRRTIDEARAADEHKRALNAIYASGIPPDVQVPGDLQRWRFNVRVSAPDRLIERVNEEGLFASRHYPPCGGGDFPVTSRVHSEIVNLFNDRYFDDVRASRMAAVIKRHLENDRSRDAG